MFKLIAITFIFAVVYFASPVYARCGRAGRPGLLARHHQRLADRHQAKADYHATRRLNRQLRRGAVVLIPAASSEVLPVPPKKAK